MGTGKGRDSGGEEANGLRLDREHGGGCPTCATGVIVACVHNAHQPSSASPLIPQHPQPVWRIDEEVVSVRAPFIETLHPLIVIFVAVCCYI